MPLSLCLTDWRLLPLLKGPVLNALVEVLAGGLTNLGWWLGPGQNAAIGSTDAGQRRGAVKLYRYKHSPPQLDFQGVPEAHCLPRQAAAIDGLRRLGGNPPVHPHGLHIAMVREAPATALCSTLPHAPVNILLTQAGWQHVAVEAGDGLKAYGFLRELLYMKVLPRPTSFLMVAESCCVHHLELAKTVVLLGVS